MHDCSPPVQFHFTREHRGHGEKKGSSVIVLIRSCEQIKTITQTVSPATAGRASKVVRDVPVARSYPMGCRISTPLQGRSDRPRSAKHQVYSTSEKHFKYHKTYAPFSVCHFSAFFEISNSNLKESRNSFYSLCPQVRNRTGG